MKTHSNYYIKNKKYTEFLSSHQSQDYQKYVDYVLKCVGTMRKKSVSFLDVGCGTGQVLELLSGQKNIHAQGIEISQTSVNVGKKKGLRSTLYDGITIPFQDESFEVVGSFNVLEHTHDPLQFLDETLRVVKKNGYLIIVCPNFLSATNSYHHHTRGLIRKFRNIWETLVLQLTSRVHISKMQPIERVEFQPDDDAVNVTNPTSLLNWSRRKKLKLIYRSSQQKNTTSSVMNTLDNSPLQALLGSCFLVFQK